jgi:hypothetical protein
MGMILKRISYFALSLFHNFDQRWGGAVYYIVFLVVFRSSYLIQSVSGFRTVNAYAIWRLLCTFV